MKRRFLFALFLLLLSACDTGSDSGNTGGEDGIIGEGDLIQVDGAVSFVTGNAMSSFIEMADVPFTHRLIDIRSEDWDYIIRIAYSGELPAGEYPISNPIGDEVAQEGIVTAGLLYLLSPDESRSFRANPIGTLTLDFGDNIILGDYALTAENPNGETVTITGDFRARQEDTIRN